MRAGNELQPDSGFPAPATSRHPRPGSGALGQNGGRHYEAAGADTKRLRLEVLYDQMVEAAAKRDLGKMLDFTRQLAKERFTAGYDLSEIQFAFNALEGRLGRMCLRSCIQTSSRKRLGLSRRFSAPPRMRSRASTSPSQRAPRCPRSTFACSSRASDHLIESAIGPFVPDGRSGRLSDSLPARRLPVGRINLLVLQGSLDAPLRPAPPGFVATWPYTRALVRREEDRLGLALEAEGGKGCERQPRARCRVEAVVRESGHRAAERSRQAVTQPDHEGRAAAGQSDKAVSCTGQPAPTSAPRCSGCRLSTCRS